MSSLSFRRRRPTLPRWIGAAVFAVASFVAVPSQGAAPESSWRSIGFLDHDGRAVRVTAHGTVRILMFTRADCAPCVIELQHFAGLQRAAKASLVVVALGDAAASQAMLSRLGIGPERSWRSADADAEVLTAFGGPPPRLPLSVAISPRGALCARRTGLLGTDLVQQWAQRCSS